MRWGAGIFLFCMLLFASVSVQAIPPHMYFDDAVEDATAIVAFLDDTISLCEQTLSRAQQGVLHLNITTSITSSSDPDALTASLLSAEEISDQLSYSSDVLAQLQGKASSYELLKDLLLPLQSLGKNVSIFALHHAHLVENLTIIVEYLNTAGGNNTRVVEAFSQGKTILVTMRTTLQRITQAIDELYQQFTTGQLEQYTNQWNQLLQTYEANLALLLRLFKTDTAYLVMFVEDNALYLGETLHIYGFFMADQGFISNQSISIFLNQIRFITTETDTNGTFAVDYAIPLSFTPGSYVLSATTVYNGTEWSSKNITVSINKIPTRLTLFASSPFYSLNETMVFTGELTTVQERPLSEEITLLLGDQNWHTESNTAGTYQFSIQPNISFGTYTIQSHFSPETIYQPSHSPIVEIQVNTPTTLTLQASDDTVQQGQNLGLTGRLTSDITGEVLHNKTISLYQFSTKLGSTITDEQGQFSFTVDTTSLSEGNYTFIARFQSNENKWRSSSSSTTITIFTTWMQQIGNSAFIIAFAAFFGIIFVLYWLYFRKRQQPLPSTSKPRDSQLPIIKHLPSSVKADDYLISEEHVSSQTIRDAILTAYHQLLDLLQQTGSPLPTSSTHRDIEQIMLSRGLSKKPTKRLTHLVEDTLYSPKTMTKRHVTSFNTQLKHLIKDLGGV